MDAHIYTTFSEYNLTCFKNESICNFHQIKHHLLRTGAWRLEAGIFGVVDTEYWNIKYRLSINSPLNLTQPIFWD